jgi:hypothetical protein
MPRVTRYQPAVRKFALNFQGIEFCDGRNSDFLNGNDSGAPGNVGGLLQSDEVQKRASRVPEDGDTMWHLIQHLFTRFAEQGPIPD